MSRFIFLISCLFFVFGCGVKGDPRPPEFPAEIGRGKPTYRRAFEKIKMPSQEDEDEDEDEDGEDNKDSRE